MQIEPKYAEAYKHVASIRNKQERYQDAVLGIVLVYLMYSFKAYDKYLNLVPSDAKVHEELGNLLMTRKKYSQALTHFEKVLEAEPDNKNAIVKREECASNVNKR